MAAIGIAFFQRGLNNAAEFVELLAELESSSSFEYGFLTEAYTEVMTALAAAGQATERVKLATGIANIYWRHPYALAMAAANVASISNGRFLLGLGTGHQPVNVAGLGYDMSKPLSRMRDYVTMLRGLLAEDVAVDQFVEVETERYRARQVRMGWPARDVPLLIGALGENMIRLAGEVSDGVVLALSPQQRLPLVRSLIAEGAARGGRDAAEVPVFAFVNVVLRDSRDEARALLRGTVEGYLRLPYYAAALKPYGFDLQRGVSDDQVDALGIAGPADYARDWLAAFREAGVDVPVLAPAGVFSLPPFDLDARAIYRRLGELCNVSD
jgi:alkanesulfonate monooxygenase SsuD/methylene tetrahydromethanopterin reductase-like flavin-dependent oxidoreductase (luciferase family)